MTATASALPAATLDALRAFPAQLEAHFAAFPPALRHWTPPSWDGVPSEAFTAIEQVCHVRDIEREGYHLRIRRTLQEDSPLLPSLDSEVLARERRYSASDAAAALADFRAARHRALPVQPRPAASGGPAMAAGQGARAARMTGPGFSGPGAALRTGAAAGRRRTAARQWRSGSTTS